MSINRHTAAPSHLRPPTRTTAAKLWRRWWLRASKARQMRQMKNYVCTPHLAKDIGIPATKHPVRSLTLW